MPLRHDWKRGHDDDSIHASGPFRLQSQNDNSYVEQHTLTPGDAAYFAAMSTYICTQTDPLAMTH